MKFYGISFCEKSTNVKNGKERCRMEKGRWNAFYLGHFTFYLKIMGYS